jgi:cell fate regulator YaaT (PSP1 superfamily)
MSIYPLPVFETDANPHHRLAMTEEERYAAATPPKSIVVKLGYMGMIAELPYDGDAKPGCGTKFVARTHRGTELVEMLTTTCLNAGCSKSIPRQDMLFFIDESGGKDFPFHTNGQILRVATIEDLNRQSAIESEKSRYLAVCHRLVGELGLKMSLVDVEPILGGELLTFYYMAEERVDFRDLVRRLAGEFKTRIEMRQVGARDEARLVADYERCGQYCCCKSFLKVLKPVSMKAAKLQKATLDPLKISGRCGRLMCCLRYEDQTYRELKANLPKRTTRVGTVEGPGVVVDSKVLVQLVLVRLEHDQREIAVPVEELLDPETCPRPGERLEAELAAAEAELAAASPRAPEESGNESPDRRKKRKRRRRRRRPDAASGERARSGSPPADQGAAPSNQGEARPPGKRRGRRRGRRRRSSSGRDADSSSPPAGGSRP